MAKVKLNPALEAIQGKVGDLVFKRFNDHEIVSRMPNRTGIVPTPSQMAQQEQFRLAVLYGKAVLADPVTKLVYEDAAARKGQPVFSLTVADFLNAPAVDEIDLAAYTGKTGDTIQIRASDDAEVQGVAVVIRDHGGATLEQGAATWSTATGTWHYTSTTTLTVGQSASIEVTATDRPGHKTLKTQAAT